MNLFIVGLVFPAPIPSDAFALLVIVLVIWLLLVNLDRQTQLNASARNKLALHAIDRELRSQYKAKRRRR